MKLLSQCEWKKLESNHRQFISNWTIPFRTRRRKRESHPVDDFLFVYYRYSSAKLEQWHPGVGYWLESESKSDALPKQFPVCHYSRSTEGIFCDPNKISLKVRNGLEWIASLLRKTESNRPNFSCLGLHEWAMVYQGHEVRHETTTKLRLAQSEIDELVESRPLTCTHFDAFRFFAKSAQPLNKTQPNLEHRPSQEQPACIHSNMDLYKWCFRAMPMVGSQLLTECFQLALEARAIDMRASPYDLSDYGEYTPIKIETSEGRAEYERLQREISKNASLLRRRLADTIESIIDLSPQSL